MQGWKARARHDYLKQTPSVCMLVSSGERVHAGMCFSSYVACVRARSNHVGVVEILRLLFT